MDAQRRICVIGGGIAGLSAAYHLRRYWGSDDLQVTLIESGSSLGGHSKTVVVDGKRSVDVGFMVLNASTYPGLLQFYRDEGVATAPSDMSFTVSRPQQQSTRHAAELRPYLRWMTRSPISFALFLWGKFRLHREAPLALQHPERYPKTLREFFKDYPRVFVEQWIIPFTVAVWSLDQTDTFDVQVFLSFMRNHGFLSWSTFQWLTPAGSSAAEVEAFRAYFAAHNVVVRTSCQARSWDPQRKMLTFADGTSAFFDGIVLAVPADQARAILGPLQSPSALLDFECTTSRVILHSDESYMPPDPLEWSSWNVTQRPLGGSFVTTYWVNKIQGARLASPPSSSNLFITVCRDDAILPMNVQWEGKMCHPKLQLGINQSALLDQSHVQGTVSFAGAWLRYGFHEDGFVSGAIAARNTLLAWPRGQNAAGTIPVLPVVNSLASLAHAVWVGEESRISHTSFLEPPNATFTYKIAEQCVIDCSSCPQYWWGGCLPEDHLLFSGPRRQIFYTIAELVSRSCGGQYPRKIYLVTTLRCFGQCMNPISVYLCFRDGKLLALVYEVSNYPWGETIPYVVDARQGGEGEEILIESTFAKQLHVSPWHPHPLEVPNQCYKTRVSLALDPTKERPFLLLTIALDLFQGTEHVFSSSWSIGRLTWRYPRPLPIAWQTTCRILAQAANIHRTGRTMYVNVTNAVVPVGAQTLGIAMVLGTLLGSALSRAMFLVCFASVVLVWRRHLPDVPLARDILYGLFLACVARMLAG